LDQAEPEQDWAEQRVDFERLLRGSRIRELDRARYAGSFLCDMSVETGNDEPPRPLRKSDRRLAMCGVDAALGLGGIPVRTVRK
jgi:hypothetical protein